MTIVPTPAIMSPVIKEPRRSSKIQIWPRGVSGSVDDLQGPSGITGEIHDFAVGEEPVDLDDAGNLPGRDIVRGNRDTPTIPEMVGATDVIAVSMRQPDLPDSPAFRRHLFEYGIEDLPLFGIR